MTEQTLPPKPRRRILGLAWLFLFIVMAAAGVFAGYRTGYDRGYVGNRRYEGGIDFWLNKPLEERTYKIGDLAIFKPGSPPDPEPIKDWLGTIHQASWDDLGGPGTVKISGPNEIKINHTAEMHEIISQVFKDIRAGREQQQQQ